MSGASLRDRAFVGSADHAPSGHDAARINPLRAGLVLSLFPDIGLLDRAFEEEGFCVVRGPDLLWGGDIRSFHPPAGVFAGIIGGPPCQSWSGLAAVNRLRWGEDSIMPDMIPEFSRCVAEGDPEWFVMENVPAAPAPVAPAYDMVQRLCDNRACGGEQRRVRRITFGARDGAAAFHIEGEALLAERTIPTVLSTGQAGKGGPRASIASMAEAQGLEPDHFDSSPFSRTELRRAIANGAPLPMGRAIAKAVKRALASRDSDASYARDRNGLGPEGVAARAEGIAQMGGI